MLVAAAVCPHPPLLLPGVDPTGSDTTATRAAAADAVGRLLDAAPDLVVLVGTADAPVDGAVPEAPQEHGPGDAHDLGGWGVPGAVALPGRGEPGGVPLPLSLAVGAALLGPVDLPVVGVSLPPGHDGAALGADLAGRADRVALLALGDGTACRTAKAPGAFDPRAEGYDAAVADALASADAQALLGLDTALGAELLVAGLPAWRALAAAAAGGAWRGELLAHEAPLGVAWLVASWAPA